MATIYFSKSGVTNRIAYRDGVVIPFEQLADDRGVLALDEEKDAIKVGDLREYVTKRIGGVREVDQETFDSLKKNLPYVRKEVDSGVKVFRAPNPFPAAPAKAVTEKAASPAAVSPPAMSATAPATFSDEARLAALDIVPLSPEAEKMVQSEAPAKAPAKAPGKQVRTGRANQSTAPNKPGSTPTPSAGASETVATSET